MEKLVELLNEFDPYIAKDGEHRDNLWYGVICGESAIFTKEIGVLKIISKEYCFIKRLVDNDKIDFDNRDLKDEFMLEFERYPVFQGNTYNWDFNENGMIMLLSIQEDPISFLISVLK